MARRVRLIDELARVRPELPNVSDIIAAGRVVVDGVVITNERSLVSKGASIVVRDVPGLRGSAKLDAALDAFGVEVAGRIALDVGAAAGGFTSVLLERGAARVYAVDVGHGQLLGSLRQDGRVVNLERTNVAALDRSLVPETVDVVTVDVSYLPLTDAVAQLDVVSLAAGADLVGLVKPMFELKAASPPADEPSLSLALESAVSGMRASGWAVAASMRSPVLGAKGAVEFLVHARHRVAL